AGRQRAFPAIAHDHAAEQANDRIARGNEMVVGNSKMKIEACIDRKKTKWAETALARKRDVELMLDLLANDRAGAILGGHDRDLDRSRGRQPLIATPAAVESQLGISKLLQMRRRNPREPRRV